MINDKLKKALFLVIVLVGLIFISLYLFNFEKDTEVIDVIMEDDEEIKIASDGTKFIVDPNKIKGGGPSKGGIGVDRGIPALDENNIKFVSVQEANEWIEDSELVLALNYKDIERVYPLQILVWHEIVNDEINDDSLLITYCPLCGSGIAYERKVVVDNQEKIPKFGTSGKLYQSNLVMYDDITDTYWQQIDGKAIVGELTGQELKEISIDTVVWRDYKDLHPNAEVLSQDTGMSRDYGRDPYGNYYEDSFLYFDVENEDNRVHSKTVVFGIKVDEVYSAYRESDLIEKGIINDEINGVKIKVERFEDGIVKITNLDNGEEIVKERDFWFAWYAFHPSTKLYGVDEN